LSALIDTDEPLLALLSLLSEVPVTLVVLRCITV
jgi:hypothetical protein